MERGTREPVLSKSGETASLLATCRTSTLVAPTLLRAKRKVSYREVFHPDHYHGLELDPRQMVAEGLSLEEKLDRGKQWNTFVVMLFISIWQPS